MQEPGVNANDEIVDQGVDTEDVRNNDLTTTDIAADTLTNADIANNDTIGDQELDDVERRIIIPASEVGAASLLGTPPTATVRGSSPALQFAAAGIDDVDLAVQVPPDRVAGTAIDVRALVPARRCSDDDRVGARLPLRHRDHRAEQVEQRPTGSPPLAGGPGTTNTLRAEVTFGAIEAIRARFATTTC